MFLRPLLVILLVAPLQVPDPDPAISMAAADALGLKIAQILASESDTSRIPASTTVHVSEVEMESFVVYWMEEDIPPKVEAIDVTVSEGRIRADTTLLFEEDLATGNPLVDAILLGTHRLGLAGRLTGANGRGEFELESVELDGIGIPLAVIDLLVSRYVTPDYPDVDLDAPFDLPWGVEAVDLLDGEARIAY